jgi:hypothetical protein
MSQEIVHVVQAKHGHVYTLAMATPIQGEEREFLHGINVTRSKYIAFNVALGSVRVELL